MLALALAFGARLLVSATLPIAVFKLAIPILLSLVVIRLSVRVLRVTFPHAHAVRVIERTVSWIAWLAVVLWITGVLPLLLEAMEEVSWKVGNTHLTLRNAVEGTLTAGPVLVVALWISAAIERQLLKGSGDDLSIRKIAANPVRALLLFIGLLLAMSAMGIDLTALSVLGGALGVGLGFGLQKIAANYVSGFVILAERSLRIGDMVRVDNFDGRVADIRTRYTVIRALSGREAIVPNEMLITQRVENLSLADMKVLLSTGVQVAYGTDVRALQPKVGGGGRGAARAGRPRAFPPARRVRRRRHEPDHQLLDRRPGERPGQRALGRQSRRARRLRARGHRDSVPAARDAPHRRRPLGGQGRRVRFVRALAALALALAGCASAPATRRRPRRKPPAPGSTSRAGAPSGTWSRRRIRLPCRPGC